MIEIIPGIYELRLPIPHNPLHYTNCYLVRGDKKHLLIDAGWNDERTFQSLEKQLAEIKIDFSDISQLVITHAHPDHYGLASRLQQLSRAKIALHSLEQNLIYHDYNQVIEFFRHVEDLLHRNGIPSSDLSPVRLSPARAQRFTPPVLPDIILNDNDTLSTSTFNLKVIWTPGHAPGHICLYEPERKILFSGDHVIADITPNVSLRPQSRPNPLGDFLSSLKKVRELEVKLTLPAHGAIISDLRKRVDEIIQHHHHRSEEVLAAIKAEPRTAYQISAEVTWMPEQGGMPWRNLAPWDKRMAAMETLAHLEYLRVEGKVSQLASNGITYYQRTDVPVRV
ncbi:MAG: MBL fold metallo-hydrolase [Chloroflexota bacterium]